jgi:hypothetical protein
VDVASRNPSHGCPLRAPEQRCDLRKKVDGLDPTAKSTAVAVSELSISTAFIYMCNNTAWMSNAVRG